MKTNRALGNLFGVDSGGCTDIHSGIGNISYVKDILTETVVTTNLSCSKFGPHLSVSLGWVTKYNMTNKNKQRLFTLKSRNARKKSSRISPLKYNRYKWIVIFVQKILKYYCTFFFKGRMNYCLRNKCPNGYAFIKGFPIKLDNHGSFRYK